MHRPSLLSIAALAATLALGCTDQPTPLAPNNRLASAPTTGLQAAGAENDHYEFTGLPISDPDRNFVLIVGVPLSEVPECGGTPSTLPGRGHVVITPSDVFHLVNRVRQGELRLYGRFVDNPCDLTAADLVASGEGNVTSRVWAKGAEVRIGIHVTGRVELVNGGLARLLTVANFVINEADGSVRVHVDKFELKPIGG